MQVDLNAQEIELLMAALNAVPVQGVQNMARVLHVSNTLAGALQRQDGSMPAAAPDAATASHGIDVAEKLREHEAAQQSKGGGAAAAEGRDG